MTSARSKGRIVGAAMGCAVLSIAMGGCLWPTTPSLKPMPMLVSAEPAGGFVATFPLCSGDAVESAGVTLTADGSLDPLRLASGHGKAPTNELITLEVTDETLSTGTLTSQLELSNGLRDSTNPSADNVQSIFAYTTSKAASVDRSSLEGLGGSTWLVSGRRESDEFSVVAVSREQGLSLLAQFCDSR